MADEKTVQNYSLKQLKDSLDYAIKNYDNPDPKEQDIAHKTLIKMNLGQADANSMRWAQQRLEQDPGDEDAIDTRNKVFSKVAAKYSAMPAEGDEGASKWHRFVAKSIPEEDQVRYLTSKGYEAYKMPTGSVKVKKPGDITDSYLDPYGFDLMDMVDVIPDAIEMGLSFASEGGLTKVARNIPLIGKYLSAPGAATAAAIGAGGDIVRQGISIASGGRDNYDPVRTLQQGAIAGGVTGAIGGLGRLLPTVKGAQGEANALVSSQIKPNAKEIQSAAKLIGAEATPGTLTTSIYRQNLEDAAVRSPNTLVGTLTGESKLKKQVAKNYEAINKSGEKLINEMSYTSLGVPADVLAVKELAQDVAKAGDTAKKAIYSKIKLKVDDASKLYNELETVLDRPGYKITQTPTQEKITQLISDYEFDDTAQAYLKKQQEKLQNVITLSDLKKYRTTILADAKRFKEDPALSRATAMISGSLDETRDKTFADLIESNLAKSQANFIKNSAKGILPKQQSTTAAIFVKEQQDKLAKASSLWRQANEELASVIKRPNEQLKGGVNYNLDKLVKESPEKAFKQVLSSGDTEKARYLFKKYPDQYINVLKTSKSEKLQKIIKDLDYNQQRSKAPGFATIAAMKSLSNEDKNLLLGVESQKIYDAMLTLYREQPRLVNSSGTSINESIIKGEFAKMNAEAFGRFLQRKWFDWGGSTGGTLDKILNNLNTKTGRAVIQTVKPNKDFIRNEGE
jgi:hypothetical protein